MNTPTHPPVNAAYALLHDGISPYTYLGVFYLKKFTALLPEGALDEAQEKALYLSFVNMQKAHENIEKIFQIPEAHTPPEDLFFPTVDEVVEQYGQGKIILVKQGNHMSHTVSKRIGICAFELLLNQLKHNTFTSGQVRVKINNKTTYTSVCFEGVNPILQQGDGVLNQGLGLRLLGLRLKEWGGHMRGPTLKEPNKLHWEITLPNA